MIWPLIILHCPDLVALDWWQLPLRAGYKVYLRNQPAIRAETWAAQKDSIQSKVERVSWGVAGAPSRHDRVVFCQPIVIDNTEWPMLIPRFKQEENNWIGIYCDVCTERNKRARTCHFRIFLEGESFVRRHMLNMFLASGARRIVLEGEYNICLNKCRRLFDIPSLSTGQWRSIAMLPGVITSERFRQGELAEYIISRNSSDITLQIGPAFEPLHMTPKQYCAVYSDVAGPLIESLINEIVVILTRHGAKRIII